MINCWLLWKLIWNLYCGADSEWPKLAQQMQLHVENTTMALYSAEMGGGGEREGLNILKWFGSHEDKALT